MQRAILSTLILDSWPAALPKPKRKRQNVVRCQVSKCDCASNFMTLFDSQPVQWKSDGTAYCPEDYHLRR